MATTVPVAPMEELIKLCQVHTEYDKYNTDRHYTPPWLWIWDERKITYRVIDTEVSVLNKEDYSAFVPENRLHSLGIMEAHPTSPTMGYSSIHTWDFVTEKKNEPVRHAIGIGLLSKAVFIGHNIKYDLHWLARAGMIQRGALRSDTLVNSDGKPIVDRLTIRDIPLVWDTQLVEYLLSSQTLRMISLDDLAKLYGLPAKPPKMKEYWEAGVLTKDIPQGVHDEYLRHDLDTTRQIFIRQYDQVMARGQAFQFLVMSQLNMLRLVTLMEWNGLCLDTKKCLDKKVELEDKIKDLEKIIEAEFLKATPRIPEVAKDQINYTANRTVEYVVYGNVHLPYTERIAVGTYKNGNVRYKNAPRVLDGHHREMCPYTGTTPAVSALTGVAEDTLKTLMLFMKPSPHKEYTKYILEHRKLSKLYGTYVSKLPTFLRNPADSIIHHNLNQCVTGTGRLSSSNPNMQNRPPIVADLFKCRAPNSARFSIDFSQIEIIALAQECKDKQLVQDLRDGVDVHWVTGVSVYPEWEKKPPSHEERREIKTVNFGIIYGGSDTTVAKQTGVARTTVAKVREALYTRYPGIKEWQEANINKVERLAQVLPGKYHDGGLGSIHYSILKSVTGRCYYFQDSESPPWLRKKTGKLTSFSPTQIKDYPIQGLATGDWVPMILADIVGAMFHHKNWTPYNTTHDDLEIERNYSDTTSIDPKPDVTAKVIEGLVNHYLEKIFPWMWKRWTSTELLVSPKVKVKVLDKEPLESKEVEENEIEWNSEECIEPTEDS